MVIHEHLCVFRCFDNFYESVGIVALRLVGFFISYFYLLLTIQSKVTNEVLKSKRLNKVQSGIVLYNIFIHPLAVSNVIDDKNRGGKYDFFKKKHHFPTTFSKKALSLCLHKWTHFVHLRKQELRKWQLLLLHTIT